MDLPENSLLPFFAYGIFKPGELGFIRLRPYIVAVHQNAAVEGTIRIRDGLPLLIAALQHTTRGSVIEFVPEKAGQAYYRIVELEPDKLYRWDMITAITQEGDSIRCNTLIGRYAERGSVAADEEWNGKQDPLFIEGLDEVRRIGKEVKNSAASHLLLVRAQMAYLLLWTVIERLASIRYHLGKNVREKVMHLAKEASFQNALREVVKEKRSVYRADDPEERLTLNPAKPENSLKYYYQVRSNATHRGKGTPVQDFNILRHSLIELTEIFSSVLDAAFEEADYKFVE